MWQFVTLPALPREPTAAFVGRQLRMSLTKPKLIATMKHQLTHRRYQFKIFSCRTLGALRRSAESTHDRVWVTLERLSDYPLPRPHVRITELLRDAAKPE